LTPGAAAIGLLAPLLVVAGRLLQGFSAGVELGGVSVYLSEIATPGNKGFYVAWQSGSQQVAVMFVALLGVILGRTLGPEQIGSWGWRIPFLVGCLIIPFIFQIRRSLPETDEFLARRHRPDTAEVLRTVAANWGLIITGVLMVMMTTVSFYFITAYTPTFGQQVLKLASIDSLIVTLCVGMTNLVWLIVAGALSDRIGRRPILHRPRAGDRLSSPVMAGEPAVVQAPPAGGALALLHLRQLQRRDGGLSHRDHAH